MASSSVFDQSQPSVYSNDDRVTTYTDVEVGVNAAVHGEIANIFEEKGDELVNFLTPNENTVLHIHITASLACKVAFVERILMLCPALLQQPNVKGETPLHLAARYGLRQVANLLITRTSAGLADDLEANSGEAVKQMLRAENRVGDTALHEAVRFGHLSVVELLTKEDPDFSYPPNRAGETPLYIASERKYSKLVREILDNCTSPGSAGPCGRTALHAATIANDEESLKKILQKMPYLTRMGDDNGWTPLHYAADLKCISTTKILLNSDADAVFVKDKRGRTTLHVAALCGHHKILSELLKNHPSCSELVDDQGCNILHSAVESNDRKTVVLILNNPRFSHLFNEKNKDGNTPLHHAATLVRGKSLQALTSRRHCRVDKDSFNDENKNSGDIVFNDDKASIRNWFDFSAPVNFGKRILDPEDESAKRKLADDIPQTEVDSKIFDILVETAPEWSGDGDDYTVDYKPPKWSREGLLVVATALVSSGTYAVLEQFNLPAYTIWVIALFFVGLYFTVNFIYKRRFRLIMRKKFYYRITSETDVNQGRPRRTRTMIRKRATSKKLN